MEGSLARIGEGVGRLNSVKLTTARRISLKVLYFATLPTLVEQVQLLTTEELRPQSAHHAPLNSANELNVLQ